ncbi:HET-domain-containing protein [Melanomma pulvis-pyrius CBS 109.77]|uniref:HET-domain-containing protein n=1 Tax=Melanomma pulvis-pyrius CBS 109.77 TaxID=1314802 RepID=A0A6A6XBZ8_9PLEO|nr:HET-domain-containing protein [Melanomma pulvis-pyrius CBS 109.77]
MVSVCNTCKSLQKHLRSLDGGVQETDAASVVWVATTLPNLRRSTDGGCRACALLLQGILLHHDRFAGVTENNIRITAESFDSSGPVHGENAQDHLSVEVRWQKLHDGCCDGEGGEHDHEEGYPDLKLEFFTDQDDQSPFSAIGRGRHISENLLQDAGLSTARAMIKDCLSRHSSCRHQKPTTLPRRVLDVLLDDGSKGVRLHEADFDNDEQRYEYGEYLTLSHCWGSGKSVLKTTNKTLQAHKKNIPWSALPASFQDAVALTRSLGFRWLWIDSLCIIQDAVLEKHEASLHIDRIFGNSFLTIAATSAAESTEGLFLPKPQLFKIQATDSKGSLYKIFVREQPSHYSFKASFDEGAHMNDWELPFNSSSEANLHTPLLKRAWAYAERLVSPRVLHFTKSEMILECREGYNCECGRIEDSRFDSRTTDSVKQEFARIVSQNGTHGDMANGSSSSNSDKRIDSMASQLAATSLADVAHDSILQRGEALQLWSYIITEYSARDLTYDVDRLSAIVGVAKMLSETLKSGYIAGHWTFNTLGLLWYPKDGARTRRPKGSPNNHIDIPSWAWASIEGSPIFFDNSTAMDLACSASFPSERGRDLTWSPTSGDTLELTAAMATEVSLQIDPTNEYSLVKNGISVEFRPDVSPLRGEDSVSAGETLICVLVSMTFRSSIIGLVLKQSESNAQLYRRVGRFECYECQREGSGDEPDDAESLFQHWFPEVEDMGAIDDGPQRTFIVV